MREALGSLCVTATFKSFPALMKKLVGLVNSDNRLKNVLKFSKTQSPSMNNRFGAQC